MRALLTGFWGNAWLLLTLTSLFWGGNAVASRLAVGEVSPVLLTQMRWLGVALLLWLVAGRAVAREWPALRPRLRYFLVMGGVGFSLFNLLLFLAAHWTTAVNIGILQGSVPVFVLIGAWLADRTPVGPVQGLGVLITTIGVAIVTTGGELAALTGLRFNAGDLLMLAACLCYSAYAVGLRRRPAAVSSLAMFAMTASAGMLATLPFTAIAAAAGSLYWPSLAGWLVIGFVVLLPSFGSQLFFMRGVQLIGPGRAGIFVNLVPIFAAIFSVLILGEPFRVWHAVSLALVLGGIWIAERPNRRDRPAAAPPRS